MFNGFKEFIMRGNAVDLAVGVVIGAAFGAVVTSLVTGIFDPLIGAVFNSKSLATAFKVGIPTVSGGHAELLFGAVIAALIQFLLTALVIYFCVVMPLNKLAARAAARLAKNAAPEEEVAAAPTDLELLAEIRDLLAKK